MMAQAVEQIPRRPEPAPNPKRWTRRECEFLRDNGILVGRYELVNGEIISKMGQKPPHRSAVLRVRNWLIRVFGEVFVQSQAPIGVAEADTDHNDPEPDAAVTRQPDDAYQSANPGPGEVILAVEVSDTTLRYDLSTKALLYSRAGVGEYWVLDVGGRQLYVHRGIIAEGYADVVAYGADEVVAPLARPDALVRVADLLPPAAL